MLQCMACLARIIPSLLVYCYNVHIILKILWWRKHERTLASVFNTAETSTPRPRLFDAFVE